MKPRYIFVTVFAICTLMFIGLPRLAHSSQAAAGANNSVAIANADAALPTILPTLPPIIQSGEQPVPTQADTAAQPTLQSISPASAAGDTLPSPVDQAAVPGQGLVAIPATSGLPDLNGFIASVSNGQASLLTGVYVPGQFAMPVVQQPDGDIFYVASADQTLTEYSHSDSYGVIGLLAHNTLGSGQAFFNLKPGQDVILVYGNGRQVRYRIDRIENYQAINPNDPYSDFIDLNGPGGTVVRNEDLFRRMYTVSGQLVFQTCFTANGDPSWGRMFVIASPT
jgi:hypothetical protein